MKTNRSICAWTKRSSRGLFAGSIAGSANCVVATGAVGLDGVGAVAIVALFVPGSVYGRVLVMPQL